MRLISRRETVGTTPPPELIGCRGSILLVDDDPHVRRLVALRLWEAGYDVAAVATSAAAVGALTSSSPSAALLDLHLAAGDTDGLACLERLRAAGFTGAAVVLSGDDTFDAVLRAVRAGADGYLVKRDVGSLPERLGRLLSRAADALPEVVSGLSDAALAYLETRGVSPWDLSLLAEYAVDFEREKEVARRLRRGEPAVRKRFQVIREALGAGSQADLVRLLRALSGFGRGRATEDAVLL